MNKGFKINLNSKMFRITATISILSILSMVGIVVAQNLRTKGPVDPLVEQVKKSPDRSLGIYQDDDTPLKILEANVKEVSAADYEKLTGEKSEFQTVISVPTARMVNVSDRTVTAVMVNIFDPVSERGKGIYMRELSIRPGHTFIVTPENFVKQEVKTSVDENSRLVSTVNEPMKSKKAWLPFADRSQVHVRIAVDFEDGTKWFNQSQRGDK